MSTEQDRMLTSRGQLARFDFTRENLLPAQQGQYMRGPRDWILRYVCPFPGELVAVSWHATESMTAGEIVGTVVLNGTFLGASSGSIPASGVTQDGSIPVKRGAVKFRAGDTLAFVLNMSADFAPETLDLFVSMYAVMYMD